MRGKSHRCLGKYLVQHYMSDTPERYVKAFLLGCIEPDRNPATYLKGSIRCQWLRGHNYRNARRFMRAISARLERKETLKLFDYYTLGKLIHYTTDAFTYAHNDTFPTAMHIAATVIIEDRVLPAVDRLICTLQRLEKENADVVKSGRTHLQDATPIKFSQEISGWRSSLERDRQLLILVLPELKELALGGTAVGTGLNAPKGFDEKVAAAVADLTGKDFITAGNKFHALTSKDELVFAHGALKALAADLMKIANDVRWLASGPRCGLGEIQIPENEPGSSIMPGKVNPTQCEAVTMVAVQVMGNDAVMGIAASQGNFELNVYMPVMAYNYLQSVRLLADGITSFTQRCLKGLTANREKMADNLHRSLMTVTALTPIVGYENGAKIAKKAHKENISLKEAAVALGLFTPEDFDAAFHPEEMA